MLFKVPNNQGNWVGDSTTENNLPQARKITNRQPGWTKVEGYVSVPIPFELPINTNYCKALERPVVGYVVFDYVGTLLGAIAISTYSEIPLVVATVLGYTLIQYVMCALCLVDSALGGGLAFDLELVDDLAADLWAKNTSADTR